MRRSELSGSVHDTNRPDGLARAAGVGSRGRVPGFSAFGRWAKRILCGAGVLAGLCLPASAGDFQFNWGTTHNWPANSTGPNTFTLTDEYGFEVDIRLSISRIGGSALSGYPDDLLVSGGNQFGLETSIWLVWDAASGSSGIGESTNTATMEVLSGGVPFSAGILSFNISDIDSVDNNGATDRCDLITATGNAGNPALSYVGAVPSARSVQIGPATGSGSTGFIAANQAQCIYNIGTTGSNTSNGDDNGTILATFPAGTHTATIAYDESIENVYGVTSRDAAARGVGVWGATIFSVGSQAISLTKTATTSSYGGAGETLSYDYVITNDGPLPINTGQNIQIQDDVIGTFNCGTITADIPVGGTHTCTQTYVTTAGDASAAGVTNNAVAGVGTGSQSFATRLQSNSASATVPRRPTLQITKISNGNTGGFDFGGDNGWTSQTITTTVSGVGVSGSRQVLAAADTVTTITETIPPGYDLESIVCSGLGSGGSYTPDLVAGTVILDAAATAQGSDISCTFTNTVPASLTIEKVSEGGVGGFTFTGDNGWSSETLTTVTPGVAVSGSTQTLASHSTATTISETIPVGYHLSSVNCSGLGPGGTATADLSAGSVTLDAAATAPGSNITCTFTNSVRPTLTLTKISNGDVGSFSFSGNNGWANQSITTSVSGVGVTGVSQTLDESGVVTTITEAVPSGYELASVSCTGLGSGGTATPNLVAGSVTLDAAATAPGSNIECTFTNTAVATLTLEKTVTNGTAVDTDFTLSFSGPVSGSGVEGDAAITAVTVPAGTYTLSESGVPSNYSLRYLTCSGATDTSTSPLNPQITLATGENVTCTFENRRGRTITLLKEVVGGPAADTDWTLNAVSTAISRSGVEGDASITGVGAFSAPLTLSETGGPAGYTLTDLSCTGTADTATSVANPIINVAVGEHAFCTFTNTYTPSFDLTKTVDLASIATTGTLTYTITIVNTGGTDLTSPVLTDTLTQDGALRTLTSGPTLAGDTDSDGVIDPTETWVYTATYDVTQSDLDDGNDLVNTAQFDTAETGSQSDSANTSLVTNASLSVVKSFVLSKGGGNTGADAEPGDTITYTYVVTNDGNQTISNVDIDDSSHTGLGSFADPLHAGSISVDNGPVGDSTDTNGDPAVWGTLAPGDVINFTADYLVVQSDMDAQP